MTRDELDLLARFLRRHLGARALPVTGTPGRGGLHRTVEQAILGIEAYLQLADQHPAPRGLAAERERAQALWERLQEIAAQWPNAPYPHKAPPAPRQAGATSALLAALPAPSER
ncbi:hypothetical protein [Streptacidiphilus melanogenes]|uniref:hypothetical protein n=1 Tax=Streptacidiphilus melanogenes TaxID=411235 RepID=UPI0005A98742|nr:hypothetical protein [Streptacidiphilus melanogenes]